MNKNIIIIVILAIVLFGLYFLFKGTVKAPAPGGFNQEPEPVVSNTTAEETPAPQEIASQEVIYADDGYSPKELKIKVGETVTWRNQSSSGMWTASAIHPSHLIYSGTSLQEHCPDVENTSFDQCASAQPGQSWSFKFNKKGIWKYHNHVRASDFGTIIVE